MIIFSLVFYQIFTRRCSLYSVLSYLGCPVLAIVLSWQSFPDYPIVAVLASMTFSRERLSFIDFSLLFSFPDCLFLVFLSLAVVSCLSYGGSPS
jgi:hypothetical protein